MTAKKVFVTAEQLAEDYRELRSIVKIAEKYGTNKGNILRYMKSFGIQTEKFPITAEQLAEDYRELKSVVKMSKKYGVGKFCVLYHMKRFGIARDENPSTPVGVVRTMAGNGLTSGEIARALGCSTNNVTAIARRHGFKVQDAFHPGYITHDGHMMRRAVDHPLANNKGCVMIHRLVMEERIGRFLTRDEIVHHLNGDRSDNRIENLQIMSPGDHARLHHAGKKKPRQKKKPPHS